jgi:hypothetical protein
MMKPYNLIRFLRDTAKTKVSKAAQCVQSFDIDKVQQYMNSRQKGNPSSIDANMDLRLNNMLEPLLANNWSFRPGAWWVAKGSSEVYGGQAPECKDTISLINKGDDASIQTMLEKCTGTGSDNKARIDFFKNALAILKK